MTKLCPICGDGLEKVQNDPTKLNERMESIMEFKKVFVGEASIVNSDVVVVLTIDVSEQDSNDIVSLIQQAGDSDNYRVSIYPESELSEVPNDQ